MGILSLFKKKEQSLLDTPPPLQTKQSPPLDLDLPPIPSLQSRQITDVPPLPSAPHFQSIPLSTSSMPTFPDLPEDIPPLPATSAQVPSSQSSTPNLQSLTPNQDTQMDAPPVEYEFDINDTLLSQQIKQQEQQIKSPEQEMAVPDTPITIPPQLLRTHNVYKEKQPEIIKVQQNKLLFISLSQYKQVINNIETMYNDVTIASDTAFRFFQLYADMEQAYNQWQRTLDQLQEDMVDLDKTLFKISF